MNNTFKDDKETRTHLFLHEDSGLLVTVHDRPIIETFAMMDGSIYEAVRMRELQTDGRQQVMVDEVRGDGVIVSAVVFTDKGSVSIANAKV